MMFLIEAHRKENIPVSTFPLAPLSNHRYTLSLCFSTSLPSKIFDDDNEKVELVVLSGLRRHTDVVDQKIDGLWLRFFGLL